MFYTLPEAFDSTLPNVEAAAARITSLPEAIQQLQNKTDWEAPCIGLMAIKRLFDQASAAATSSVTAFNNCSAHQGKVEQAQDGKERQKGEAINSEREDVFAVDDDADGFGPGSGCKKPKAAQKVYHRDDKGSPESNGGKLAVDGASPSSGPRQLAPQKSLTVLLDAVVLQQLSLNLVECVTCLRSQVAVIRGSILVRSIY
ncbi:unnamed protein product [Protopolystoma xenopodis]|uniref:Uncharacterized protein n=1 Tax=Protopolystoma xenopodis TaxID=117903 RepID=A0A448WSL5_9PLAT|nr:unnamed protein product [Protopolystoma xenopodis]